MRQPKFTPEGPVEPRLAGRSDVLPALKALSDKMGGTAKLDFRPWWVRRFFILSEQR